MQTYITLNDSTIIPQFGLGVYQVPEGEATYNTVLDALKMGVRHIDTAHAYQNERSVGKAVKASSIPREEIWITTKLWPHEYGEGKTSDAIDKMLKRLDTDYIDLLLLHQQFGDYLGAWKDMEKAVKAGKVKSIGISNFESDRLEELCEAATIKPSVLQVECHPLLIFIRSSAELRYIRLLRKKQQICCISSPKIILSRTVTNVLLQQCSFIFLIRTMHCFLMMPKQKRLLQIRRLRL